MSKYTLESIGFFMFSANFQQNTMFPIRFAYEILIKNIYLYVTPIYSEKWIWAAHVIEWTLETSGWNIISTGRFSSDIVAVVSHNAFDRTHTAPGWHLHLVLCAVWWDADCVCQVGGQIRRGLLLALCCLSLTNVSSHIDIVCSITIQINISSWTNSGKVTWSALSFRIGSNLALVPSDPGNWYRNNTLMFMMWWFRVYSIPQSKPKEAITSAKW
jgi:hypothetical protein